MDLNYIINTKATKDERSTIARLSLSGKLQLLLLFYEGKNYFLIKFSILGKTFILLYRNGDTDEWRRVSLLAGSFDKSTKHESYAMSFKHSALKPFVGSSINALAEYLLPRRYPYEHSLLPSPIHTIYSEGSQALRATSRGLGATASEPPRVLYLFTQAKKCTYCQI